MGKLTHWMDPRLKALPFSEIRGFLSQPRLCVSQAARWTLPVTNVGIPTEVLVSEATIPGTSQSTAKGFLCRTLDACETILPSMEAELLTTVGNADMERWTASQHRHWHTSVLTSTLGDTLLQTKLYLE